MRTTAMRLIALVSGVLALAACSVVPRLAGAVSGAGVPYPAGCSDFGLSRVRCRLAVDFVGQNLGIDPTSATEIRLLGPTPCSTDPNVLCSRSISVLVRVRFITATGQVREDEAWCGPGSPPALCDENPGAGAAAITFTSPLGAGYRDLPEGASPVPPPDPSAVRAASPLRVATLDIPIDHPGHYDITLGEATLPNGILSLASLQIADTHPDGFFLERDLGLAIHSLDGRGDIVNIYDHGWHEGVERVEVHLVFDVLDADPGGTLQIRDVVVG